MPSPKLSVRVPDETYSVLLKLAEAENKSMADLVRDLIESGLKSKHQSKNSKQPTPKPAPLGLDVLLFQVLNRLDEMENNQQDLLLKSTRAAFEARFFSRLATSFGNDIAGMLMQQAVFDSDSKQKFLAQMEATASKLSWAYASRTQPSGQPPWSNDRAKQDTELELDGLVEVFFDNPRSDPAGESDTPVGQLETGLPAQEDKQGEDV